MTSALTNLLKQGIVRLEADRLLVYNAYIPSGQTHVKLDILYLPPSLLALKKDLQ